MLASLEDSAQDPDTSVRLSHRSWHTWVGSGLLFALLLGAPRALACGATPDEIYPLLPVPGQEGVSQNAALTIGLSYAGDVTFELEEVESGAAVALLEPSCAGEVCTVHPVVDLEAITAYRYRARFDFYPEGEGEWVEFSTGDGVDQTSPRPEHVVLTLVSAAPAKPPAGEEHPCGYFRRATVDIHATGLEEPVAFVAESVTPSYFTPPVVLTEPGTTSLDIVGAPACFTPWLIDAAGHRTELEEVCLPADGLDPDDESEPASEDGPGASGGPGEGAPGASGVPGCAQRSHGAHLPSAALLLALCVGVAGSRRRRMT